MAGRVCLCLCEGSLAAAAALLDGNRDLVDMAELRADYLEPEELPRLGGFARTRREALILTLRRAADGGKWLGSEGERLSVLSRALAGGGFAFVDVEADLDAGALGPLGKTRLIRSLHDFRGVPSGLSGKLRELGRGGAIAKIAVMPKGCADLRRLLEEVGRPGGERIVVGMGEYGFPTRVLASRLGSWLTYCSAEAGKAAPGQTTPGELRELYRFPGISVETRLFGVIGNPIAHTLSPRIHNAGLATLGLDAAYLPFLVDDVGQFLEVADLLGIAGLSVTVPHKSAVIPHLSRRDPSVEAIGACNTMLRESGGWFGTNTDWGGFLAPLRGIERFSLSSTRATVIGAGGAARAVAYALRAEGAAVLVLNRNIGHARGLAAELGCAAGPLGEEGAALMASYGDLVVQTTSCGMEPDVCCDPIPEYAFRGTELVYELVYRPAETAFLGRAAAAGCRWIGGMDMLLHQAYGQFRLFTGMEYPRGQEASTRDAAGRGRL